MELPPAALLFRSARQYVYGVLFSLAEAQRKVERLAIRRRLPMEGKYESSYSSYVRAYHTLSCKAVFKKMHHLPDYTLK